MIDLKKLFNKIDRIADKIPLGVKETRDEIGISLNQWYNLRNGKCMPHARTVRKMKAFIEKYKELS